MTAAPDTILIAPDKFKGSLTAHQAAEIMADVLRGAGYGRLLLCPMADGGEGTPHVLNGLPVVVSHDHIGAQCFAGVDVMHRSSFALGEAIAAKLAEAPSCYVAVGGTATTDGGAGLLQALGVRFSDASGSELTDPITPGQLPDIRRIEVPLRLRESISSRVTVLSDVRATLFGPGLSSLDFARQKGASDSDMAAITTGLHNLDRLLAPLSHSPFDGAGGGVGYALASVLGATGESGASAILASRSIDWSRISLVISGEGQIDIQTPGGKVPDLLLREARRRNIPFIGVGGYVAPEIAASSGRDATYLSCISSPGDYQPAKAAERLRETMERCVLPILEGLTQP